MRNNLLKPDSAKKNFVFQIIYQTVILVIPLVVSPYLTRTMGSNALGVYTYTYSIAYYFVVFAMLGINRHGQRIIAQRRSNFTQLRKTFWSLYTVHFIASALVILAYIVYVAFVCGEDRTVAFVQTIYVLSAALDITWLFYGLEKFRLVAVRNAVVKVVECICILLFIKSADDLILYTIIMCVSNCLGQAIMLPQAISAIPPIRFGKADFLEHMKPLCTLFVVAVAVSLYTMFDKTLLGVLSTKDNVAFYEYSDKIVKIPRTFIGIIGTVLFPRACRYAAEKDFGRLRRNFINCQIVTSVIGFAAAFGLVAVSGLFARLYYGESFAICGNVISWMSPIILIIGFGENVRQCYIYPMGKDTTMVKILSLNAAVNLVLTSVLIPVWGIYGAVVGTISAELVGLVIEIWICREYLSVKDFMANALLFAVIGFIMYLGVKGVAHFYDGTMSALLIQIVAGAFIYGMLTLLYGFFYNKALKQMILNILGVVKKRLHM